MQKRFKIYLGIATMFTGFILKVFQTLKSKKSLGKKQNIESYLKDNNIFDDDEFIILDKEKVHGQHKQNEEQNVQEVYFMKDNQQGLKEVQINLNNNEAPECKEQINQEYIKQSQVLSSRDNKLQNLEENNDNQNVQNDEDLKSNDGDSDNQEDLSTNHTLQNQKQIPIKQIPSLSESTKSIATNIIENKRAVEIQYKFYIREQLNKVGLQQNYQIKQLKIKKELQNHCDSMIPVRGDGNCFYTAFGYQFIKLLINDPNYLEEVKQNYSNIEMKLNKDGFALIEDLQKEEKLRKSFFDRIDFFGSMKNAEERNKKFEEHFAAFEEKQNENDLVDGYFNVLTVIFLRNLAFKLVMESDELRDAVFDRENLLIWEKECNNNEPIISLLAKHLKLKVKVLMFENSNFILLEYEPENKDTIILLMKPGHYNIGIKN